MQRYDPQRHRTHAALYSGHDPGMCCRVHAALALWLRGYPDQAVTSSQAALVLTQQLAHPLSLTLALIWAATIHHLRRDAPRAQAMALQGWVLAIGGQGAAGLTQIQQGLAAYRATGVTRDQPYYLALLAEVSIQANRVATGLEALAEALTMLATCGGYWWEAELDRLTGELLLAQKGTRPKWGEAAAHFCQALAIAQRQQAKSLELRAAMSLAHLWQRQGKRAEAYELLAPIYGWFTEGFDTTDLQEARALLAELRE